MRLNQKCSEHNIPQEEETGLLSKHITLRFHNNKPAITLPITKHITYKGNAWLNPPKGKLIPSQSKEMELAMGTVSLAQSFMSLRRKLENKLIIQSDTELRECKRYIDDAFYLWAYSKKDLEAS